MLIDNYNRNTLTEIKKKLYDHCRQFVEKRIAVALKAMNEAQEAANEESRSSSGDKYETGRAMMHLEKEKNARQLAEALKLQEVLDKFKPEVSHDVAQLGSLVITNQGNFYVSISAGKINLHDQPFILISPGAPLGAKLLHLKKGDQVVFNSIAYYVEQII